jgi:hypothetical protein
MYVVVYIVVRMVVLMSVWFVVDESDGVSSSDAALCGYFDLR